MERRIRSLWKLPDGRDSLRGRPGLVLMGRAMLSKSSVDGWICVLSLLFTWSQTIVEVMKIMVTSFKRSHAFTAILSAPNPAAGHCQPTPRLRLLDTHGQVWVSLLWCYCSFLLGPGHTKLCLCPPRVYFPVLHKFWLLYGGVNGDLLREGLCHIHVCTQSPCPCGSPLLTCTSAGDSQT